MPTLSGLIAATHTPFDSEGELNRTAIEKQASYLWSQGIRTVFIGGTTGECHSLTVEERLKLAQRWAEVSRGTDLQIIVHVGANCLKDSQRLASHAQEIQAVAIAALTPSYFKPNSIAILVECMQEIARVASNLPFYYYDIPSLTGVNLPMDEFLTQASDKIPNLAGIKFTNIDLMMYQLCRAYQQQRFNILWGTDEMLLAALAMGAQGAVGSTYNFAAKIYQDLISAWEGGDWETARQAQFRSLTLVRILSRRGFMASAKYLMKRLGVDVGPPRLPNRPLSQVEMAQLDREFDEFDIESLRA